MKKKSSFSKWNKFKSVPGGIGTSPDPILLLDSPLGIVNQEMNLCIFFSLITFGVGQNFLNI